MKLAVYVTIVLFGLLSVALAAADNRLTPHKAEYKVKIAVVSGKLNTELQQTADGYIARHVVRPTGMSKLLTRGTMDVTSEFARDPAGVKPVRFKAIDTIRKDPDVDLRFDWVASQAVGTVGDEAVTLELDGISHDSVSIQYELMHDLLNGSAESRYTIFDIDKMRVANVTDGGEKQVKTKAGVYDVVGIKHQREGSSRITTMWCAPELDYLPVVIEQHRKGKLNFRATLVSYVPTGT